MISVLPSENQKMKVVTMIVSTRFTAKVTSQLNLDIFSLSVSKLIQE